MKTPHILHLGNPRKVKQHLSGILNQQGIDRIEAEIADNTRDLFELGREHFRFASRQNAAHWRQKVSRLYYAAYSVSRAVRLFVSGEYSADTKDHQRVDALPSDFPSRGKYVLRLPALREDRNLCDYDHTSFASDLSCRTGKSTKLVAEFIEDARIYLASKGLNLRR